MRPGKAHIKKVCNLYDILHQDNGDFGAIVNGNGFNSTSYVLKRR